MSAGYSGTPLAKKLGIKAGFKVLLMNEPEYYPTLFDDLPEIITDFNNADEVDFIHLFALKLKDFEMHFDQCKSRLVKNGTMWVSWPKKASKIETDLDGNVVREYGLNHGLVDVKVCAVDETWSGLKFMYRLKDR
ncbi:DUF3052 domain-containing protein [Fulvivirga lutimaris]|uniref:DUF3052 domain-containing protein n=1 Tax=Fulvivirga lutimaris TaxID=1819566 RepID=UPI0012BD6CC1|nr:DUF3052 domain-containing protein [Fulvivirga lutimaris]MTI40409.1 DUF3052 domain-containing protein [Fulvivirga lutimaris]